MFAAPLTTFILKANSLHFLFAMQFFKFTTAGLAVSKYLQNKHEKCCQCYPSAS